ncbi:MAG: isoleucine--tRNA ligase [Candidatus Thermoplasmatota archaeon]|nr:isoleucine--tRNA ligase [Candidatus Thermoplasmatota archaeon]MBU1940279.1 isoleucine--tRNA ligase [Candidatus Thermoplasmatota archaeon]
MIQTPPQKYSPRTIEKKILTFWQQQNIFQKSIDQRKGQPPFVFLEGPPTANGMPHPGHVLTRVMKDLILRYQAMHGHYILRKAGWDTHGLPVEIEVEKNLGLEDKQGIEKYGVTAFNEECKKCVFKYENAWVHMTQRIGFWLDMDHPYITLKNEYIESVWWSLKQAWEKKLLYKGHKVVPYCPRCGTVLSAHEMAQGYKTIEEPSIFVKFKLKNEDAYFLAWTTTPWTLLSNVALAVHPNKNYLKIRYNGQVIILAEERAAYILKGQEYELLDSFKGKELEHTPYEPLFDFAPYSKKGWYIVLADFVTMDDGTGIVHIAPAFGEDDYTVGRTYDLPVVQLVRLDGTFPKEVTLWAGQFVKDADPSIIEYLDERGMLEGQKAYAHEYPFCWRCDSPLLYYALESWFIAMTKVQESLIKNNNQIHWFPPHLQQGRFGDFIRDVKDWALSRDRFWGTPLPIWTCNDPTCHHQLCIGSIQELKELSENFTEDYELHKPYIDTLILHCPKCNSTMTREKEVIDCWYDSGSSFFAQWHYPFEHQNEFKQNFPIDFISEALDQTRGWFYSLLAISTFLFDQPSYKTVLTLGLVLDKDNQKMSKSKQNYVDPTIILDNEGADALRWYLFSANAPWNSTRFYEDAVKDTLGKFILTLWNSYNFFATYAILDAFTPEDTPPPIDQRPLLDQWILSSFHSLLSRIPNYFDTFETHKAARDLESFLIEDFSNWYLRRSRKRLWEEQQTADKRAAYHTLYDIFLGLTKTLAPFIPFITEEIYQNLKTPAMPESIHLCDYPQTNYIFINTSLENAMQQIRELVEAGRALRSKIGIKVRYPLKEATIICKTTTQKQLTPLLDLLKDELNVKTITFHTTLHPFMRHYAKPNYSILGPKYKQLAKPITDTLTTMDRHTLTTTLETKKKIILTINTQTITLTKDDFTFVEEPKPDIALTELENKTIILHTTLTPELEAEGLAREIIRRIQSMRKDQNLEVEQQITTELQLPPEKEPLITPWLAHISTETRSHTITLTKRPKGTTKTWTIDDLTITIGITL